jgi:hypothetical protein
MSSARVAFKTPSSLPSTLIKHTPKRSRAA